MNLFKDLVKKYGLGLIVSAATLDGYRRQLVNDRRNNILDEIQKQRNSLSEDTKAAYDKIIEESFNNTKNKGAILRYNEAADEHKKAVDNYNASPTEYNNNEVINANNKLNDSFDEIQKLDISEFLTSVYNKYGEFLDSLTPDKIVCLFNIIIDALVLSSFLSVLSIMLSDNIINKIGFLEKYPRILNLLKLRNNINKKVSKIYLLMHFFIILFGILGNIWMFFI
jgi:ABC-type antimicrobial peptide transport system permease subunit